MPGRSTVSVSLSMVFSVGAGSPPGTVVGGCCPASSAIAALRIGVGGGGGGGFARVAGLVHGGVHDLGGRAGGVGAGLLERLVSPWHVPALPAGAPPEPL